MSKKEPRMQVYINGVLQEDVSHFAIDVREDDLKPRLIKSGESYGVIYTMEKRLK